MSDLINLSICLSDIPKDKIKRAGNGKCYANITTALRRDPDQHGNTHSVYMSQTKEERGSSKIYIGAGKGVDFNQPATASPSVDRIPVSEDEEKDDLPF